MFDFRKLKRGAAVACLTGLTAAFSVHAEGPNMLSLSLGDMYAAAKGDGRVDTPERLERAITNWSKMNDAGAVVWRIEDQHIDHFDMAKTGYIKWHRDKVLQMRSQFNHHAVARKVCDKLNLKLILNYSFNDGGWPQVVDGYRVYYCYQDKHLIAHPELQEVDKRGIYHYGYLDLSNPEARKFIIGRIMEYMNITKADGLYLNSRSHSGVYSSNPNYKPGPHHADRFGFGRNLVAEYKKRYGIDITKDPRFDYQSPDFAPKSPEVENWRKLRGEYFLTFYKEVKKAIGNKMLILTLPLGNYMGSSGGNIFVDHKRIIEEKLGDALQLGVASGFVPVNKIRKLGYLSSEERDANYNVPTLENYLKRYGKLIASKGIKVYSFIQAPYSSEMARLAREIPHLTGYTISLLPNVCHPVVPDQQAIRPKKGVFSCEAVIRPTYAGYSLGRIFSKFNHKISRPSQRGWELIVEQDKSKAHDLRLKFRVFAVIPQPGKKPAQYPCKEFNVTSDEIIPYNRWSHIGATWDVDNGRASIYLNGKCIKRVDVPRGAYFNQNTMTPCFVGCYAGAFGYDYTGMIESFRFSSRPVPETGKIPEYTGKEPGTLLYVDYSQGREAPVADLKDGKMKYLLTPKFKEGRDGRKALWFNDEK